MISFAEIEDMAIKAQASLTKLSSASASQKNLALEKMQEAIKNNLDKILEANKKDVDAAKDAGLSPAEIDRLELNTARVEAMLTSLEAIINLDDPIGKISDMKFLPSGIQLGKMQVPIGVIGMIYEARPNVTVEAASLCLKSANAIILRGGSESINSNIALGELWKQALQEAQLPEASIQVLQSGDRDGVTHMLSLDQYINLLIPRGGKSLVEKVTKEAKMPVLKHLSGNCHIYVDETADLENAIEIIMNAKTQRYGTCNTLETLLLNQNIATGILNNLVAKLKEKQVEIRACDKSIDLIEGAIEASEDDWFAEYLAPVLAIKILPNLDSAISHINFYGSGHTDSILTNSYKNAQKFLRLVDSSSVMVNASTRFADGFEYGLGGEIGISTDKFHARGPVALDGLTTKKYIVLGQGQIRK